MERTFRVRVREKTHTTFDINFGGERDKNKKVRGNAVQEQYAKEGDFNEHHKDDTSREKTKNGSPGKTSNRKRGGGVVGNEGKKNISLVGNQERENLRGRKKHMFLHQSKKKQFPHIDILEKEKEPDLGGRKVLTESEKKKRE